MRMVLLGPPGAGKGTHAVDLSKKYGLPHISTGEILRAALKNGTPTGLKAKSFMDKGELVPDSVVAGIVAERIALADCRKGFILDGFPRNLAQARVLDETLDGLREKLDAVLYLATQTKTILRRLTGRRVCKNCAAVYNIFTMPSKKEGICDVCGSALIQREDDQEKTILNRLAVYEAQTKDLIAYYKKRKVLIAADGNMEREEGFRALVEALQGVAR